MNASTMLLRLFLLTLIGFSISSCEKAISFSPQGAENEIVVEAVIEDGQYPVVTLSRSLGFFSSISPEILSNAFVHNAVIEISDGSHIQRLYEDSVITGPGFVLYHYSPDSLDAAASFRGILDQHYTLNIKAEGKEYFSETTIPTLTKTFDSLWWESSPDNPDSSKVILMGRSTDPPGFGNYIRYFTRTNNGRFFPGLASVFDDQIIDGKTYSIQIEKGVDRNTDIDFENYSFFEKGDFVTVKLCNIDKQTFDFWRTIEFSYSSIGNPFSSPTKVLGNIKGGALGYFGGYACQYSSLKIPD